VLQELPQGLLLHGGNVVDVVVFVVVVVAATQDAQIAPTVAPPVGSAPRALTHCWLTVVSTVF